MLVDVFTEKLAVAELEPLRVTELGDTPQVRPSPPGTVQVRTTVPVKPARDEIVRVELVDFPGATVALVGEVVILKSGGVILKATP